MEYTEIIYLVSKVQEEDAIGNITTSSFTLTKRYAKKQSIRIYLYEAATIILSSIIIGTFIGVIISASLILQFDIFIELPFPSIRC